MKINKVVIKNIIIVVSAALFMLFVWLFVYLIPVIHYNNVFIDMETSIVAYYDNTPNILTKTTNNVVGKYAILKDYRADFKEIVKSNITGRYGADGSKATWSWIQEHNLNIDPKMFQNIMDEISSGGNELQQNQKDLIDTIRVYNKVRNSYWGSRYNKWGNLKFPKIDMDKYSTLILSDTAVEARETNRFNGVKLQ